MLRLVAVVLWTAGHPMRKNEQVAHLLWLQGKKTA
jgi:hypothetical protein